MWGIEVAFTQCTIQNTNPLEEKLYFNSKNKLGTCDVFEFVVSEFWVKQTHYTGLQKLRIIIQ